MPSRAVVRKAVRAYLRLAYDGAPPASVQARLDALERHDGTDLRDCPMFERGGEGESQHLALRLGNRFYPHMKLIIEPEPGGARFLFRADTHDAHCCPAQGSEEHDSFRDLMEKNQRLAAAIEATWSTMGVPTGATALRDALQHRRARDAGPRAGGRQGTARERGATAR